MRKETIRFIYFMLAVIAILFKNFLPGYWLIPILPLPILFLQFVQNKDFWGGREKMRKFGSLFLLSEAIGFSLISIEPNFYGIYFAMVFLLIAKFFFLQLLRWTLGYFAVTDLKNILLIALIGSGFILFFHFCLLDHIDTFFIYPIFIYIFIDTITVYSIFLIMEENKPYKWLGFWSIAIFVFSDVICSMYLFMHVVRDNYTCTLITSYLGIYLCTCYIKKVHGSKLT